MSTPTLVGAPPTRYAGLATLAVALAVDVAIAQVIFFAGGAVFALVFSLVGDPDFDTLGRVLTALVWAGVVGFYFVLFWSTAGRTPGMRLMALRVMTESGAHPSVWRSCVRLVALGLCIIPLCAGFLTVLVDDQRRGLHDMLARTVVVYVDA